jgi:hypothetical protein
MPLTKRQRALFGEAEAIAIKDHLAEIGMTEDDLRELIQKLEGSDKRH